MTRTCDKNRIPIRVGDVLKVFHFIGARRRQHFMYKQVVGEVMLGRGTPYFKVSHLSMNDEGYYELAQNEGRLSDYEIVQSPKCDHEDRERV